MFTRLVIIAAALAASPSAFAQQSSATDTIQNEPLPLFYSSLGLAWSGEIGLEIEAGLQWELGDVLRFRLSPVNLSLFDGDIPDGFFWDDDGFDRECRDVDTGNITFDDECSPEPDAEWRSVAEAQLRVAPGIHFGGGVTYMLQGDFSPEGAASRHSRAWPGTWAKAWASNCAAARNTWPSSCAASGSRPLALRHPAQAI